MDSADSGGGTRCVDLEQSEGEAEAGGDTESPDLAVMTRSCFIVWTTRGSELGDSSSES